MKNVFSSINHIYYIVNHSKAYYSYGLIAGNQSMLYQSLS